MKTDFAILSAMPEESEFYHEYFSEYESEIISINNLKFKIYQWRDKRILCGCTGLGTSFSAATVTLIYTYFNPEYIFFSGTAGGIDPKLNLRDVIVATSAFEAEMHGIFDQLQNTPFESCLTHPLKKDRFPQLYTADQHLIDITQALHKTSTVHYGTVVSSNMFPAPLELFEKIKERNPLSIDMETSALYQTAWLLGMRALAVRSISNILNTDGTDENVKESDVHGSAEAAARTIVSILNRIVPELSPNQSENIEEKATPIHPDAEAIIRAFKLNQHPEGGYYARTFQSDNTIKSSDKSRYNNETRPAGTAIYYLLNGKDFSAWHQLKSDEIWHFYKGSSAAIHVIDATGNLSTHILGDPTECQNASFQVIIPAGCWFAAEPLDKSSYCLVGCTVTPGFEFSDFKLADRNLFTAQYPQHTSIIHKLTRITADPEIILDGTSEEVSRNRYTA